MFVCKFQHLIQKGGEIIDTYYKNLIAKAKAQMVLMSLESGQRITYETIAKKTGYAPVTIRAFFCRSGRKSDRLAAAIAKALEIEI
jgi:cyanate lyase